MTLSSRHERYRRLYALFESLIELVNDVQCKPDQFKNIGLMGLRKSRTQRTDLMAGLSPRISERA